MGGRVGKSLEIRNDARAQHTGPLMPRANSEGNERQMTRGKPILRVFQKPEMMMPIQCNQHPWMKTWLNVMDHPYFAVTSEDGRYEIRNLPPGEYTVAAVTGSLKEQTVKIKAVPRGEANADFIFTPGP